MCANIKENAQLFKPILIKFLFLNILNLNLMKFLTYYTGLVLSILVSQFSFSQTTMEGKVTDQNNQPLFGANIVIQNTYSGTTTDEEGNLEYSIVPGHPDQSILLYRMDNTEPGIMMPEIGRSINHNEGVALISEYIKKPYSCRI
jgi:hypothetical protein